MDGGAWWAAVHGVAKSWDMTVQGNNSRRMPNRDSEDTKNR